MTVHQTLCANEVVLICRCGSRGGGCNQSTHLVKSTYVFNCGGQLIAEESIVAKISNSGEKAGFGAAFAL
jgi:hypothetical protein